jgi:hypothetical protein
MSLRRAARRSGLSSFLQTSATIANKTKRESNGRLRGVRMRTAAERNPEPKGAKVTSMVQFALTASAPVQVLLARLKSLGFEPVRRTEAICSVATPALVRVTVCEALVVP